jgi:HEAT repeat protein
MSDPSSPRPTLSSDDALPRVEPPTATFIVQLFVVPAIIVLVIVSVWVLFNWLAQMGSDPSKYLQQISKQNANSWIAAHNLAEELRTSPELRKNSEVAKELAAMLKEAVAAGRSNHDDIQLRVFMCRALGEFYVADGLPALLEAAETQRSEKDIAVRRSALEAIALLISHLREHESASTALDLQVLPMLEKASHEEETELREGAAYALGVLGGDEANRRLEQLLSDTQANVRFNAATGLARQGREQALPVLIEMLDAEDLRGVSEEEGDRAQDFKRALIVINGLRAARQLIDARPDVPVMELRQAVSALAEAPLERVFKQSDYAIEVRSQAQALAEHLHSR